MGEILGSLITGTILLVLILDYIKLRNRVALLEKYREMDLRHRMNELGQEQDRN